MANECQPMRIVELKPGKTSNYRAKIVLEVSAVYEMEVRMAADSLDCADAQADDFVCSPEMDKLTNEFIETQLPKTIGDLTLAVGLTTSNLMSEWPEEI